MSRKFLTPVVLPADPAAPLEAATKQYVDGKPTGIDQTTADARYVNIDGDTMTGNLTINGTSVQQLVVQGSGTVSDVRLRTNTGEVASIAGRNAGLEFNAGGAGKYVAFMTNLTARMYVFDTYLSAAVPLRLPADPTLALEAATKQYVDGKAGGGSSGFTFSQDTVPTASKAGDTWYMTSTGYSYVWTSDGTSTQWVQFAPGAGSGSGGGFTFVSDIQPTPTKVGDTWFDTSTASSGGTSWVAIEEAPAGEKVWVQVLGGSTVAPAAATIPFTPTSTISANTVQAAIEEVVTDSVAAAQVPWISLPLTSPWAHYGAPYGPAWYRKVQDEVQLRGLVSGGALGSVIATLPVGYRPQYEPIFIVSCGSGIVEVRVNTGGAVSIPTAYAGGAPSGWTSLSQVRFSTL